MFISGDYEWMKQFKWLAVVGARSFLNPRWDKIAKDLVLEAIDHLDEQDRVMGIVSGGAQGVDLLGESIADELWFRKVVFSPENQVWEPNGFKARNERIAKACNWMIGIRCESTKSGGTVYSCNTAEQSGKLVWRFVIHQSSKCEGCPVESDWKSSCKW